MLLNTYVMYVIYNLVKRKKRRDLLSHHDFRRAIIMYWINPEYHKKHKTRVHILKQKRNGEDTTISSIPATLSSRLRTCTPRLGGAYHYF